MIVTPKRRQRRRNGLTLLEVILATAIFVAAITVIGQLLQLGLLAAEGNRRHSIAVLHCEAKLQEILAGIQPLDATEQAVPYPDYPDWRWRAEAMPTNVPRLSSLTVTVEHLDENEEVDYEFQLSRLMLMPPEPTPSGSFASTTLSEEQPLTVERMLGLSQVEDGEGDE